MEKRKLIVYMKTHERLEFECDLHLQFHMKVSPLEKQRVMFMSNKGVISINLEDIDFIILDNECIYSETETIFV